VFVTTKLWNNHHRPELVKPAFEASCQRLRLDYVDCYLVHTPFAFQPGDEQDPRDERGQVIYDPGVTLVETWQALERLVDEGQCKTIGLSNIDLEKLREIVEAARIKPAVVEVESHPYLPEWELLEYCQHRAACQENPRPSPACLGGTTRHRVPDDHSYARPHPGEPRAFDPAGRRHAGDSGRSRDEDPVQYRRRDREIALCGEGTGRMNLSVRHRR